MNNSNRALIGISSAHFILDLYAAILIPLYPLIASQLNIDIVTISFVIAISHSLCSFLQPVFGYLSEKLNQRIFIILGLIFCALFFPLAIYAKNALILTLCLIMGIMGNAFFLKAV
jgi:MFS family permease